MKALSSIEMLVFFLLKTVKCEKNKIYSVK